MKILENLFKEIRADVFVWNCHPFFQVCSPKILLVWKGQRVSICPIFADILLIFCTLCMKGEKERKLKSVFS